VTLRARAYLRVSTDQQAEDSRHGFARQRKLIEAYGKTIGVTAIEYYQDAITGRTANRVELERLLSAPKKGADIIIISETRALGRRMSVSYAVLDELLDTGLPVHSASIGGRVDLDNDASVIQISTSAMIDHIERNRIATRTLNARVAMAEHQSLPSGIKAYGYLSLKGRAIEHPENGPTLKRIFSLSASGISFTNIAAMLHQEGVPPSTRERKVKGRDENGEPITRVVTPRWHISTVAHIVRNPVYYQGFVTWGRYRIPVPPLVSEELWRKAQRRQGAPERLGWSLTGHLRCGVCGKRMSGRRYRSRNSIIEVYRCQGAPVPGEKRCYFGMARHKVEALFETALGETLSDPAAVRDLLSTHTQGPDHADKLAALNTRSKEAFDTWRRGIISADELGIVRREIEAERSALSAQPDEPHPVMAYLDEFTLMDTAEILGLFPIVATLSPGGVLSFAIE
jgi:site-specific DNA recombinase